MTEATKKTGSCLCGAISITTNTANNSVGTCHCGMCRKWGGGPFMVVGCGTDIAFTGADAIAVYDSSDWAERGFCKDCGSHLFYRLKKGQQHMVPVGLFDDQEHFVLERQVCIDKKPSFYQFSNKTNEMTEAEMFAKASSS